jgi:hypothetical protein
VKERPSLTLHPSESVVVRAAADIYAAYIAAGKVVEGKEKDWMQRSIDEAVWLAMRVDESIRSDNEMV